MSKLVDHGSVMPAIRTSKYTVFPSGAKLYSLSSPNGLDGTSPSIPNVRCSGSAAEPIGVMKSCERRPSDQVSQCRIKRRSYTLPVALSFFVASRRAEVHAIVLQSVNTCEENNKCC